MTITAKPGRSVRLAMRGMRATGRNGLDGYDKSKDAAWEGRAARAALLRDAPEYAPVLAGPGCWCGAAFGHDWPGKADGAPHPRRAAPTAMGGFC